MSKAAPDVDLRSKGKEILTAGVIIGGLVIYYRSAGTSRDPEENLEQTWLSWVLWLLFRVFQGILVIVLLMLGVLVAQQRKIIYVPVPPGTQRSTKENPSIFKSPSSWGLPYMNLDIPTEDGVNVNAWFVYQPIKDCSEKAPYTLIYFHGNAGNIGHRLENIHDMYDKLKVNVLILDYRGFGDSGDGGGPTQVGIMKDAHAVYQWLADYTKSPPRVAVTKTSLDRVILFGRSLGGAVAINLMSDLVQQSRKSQEAADDSSGFSLPAGMVLENTFTALRSMAIQIFPFLDYISFLLAPPLLFDPWDSCTQLRQLTEHHDKWCCCLLSGMMDQIVPPAQMTQLHGILKERRPQVLKFYRFPHGGHNDTPNKGGTEYWDRFKTFMGEVARTEDERLHKSTSNVETDTGKRVSNVETDTGKRVSQQKSYKDE